MKRALVTVLLLGSLAACSAGGGDVSTPTTDGVTTTASPLQEDQTEVGLELIRKDGKICQICVKVANTPEKRQQGLSDDGALDGVDGMLFYSGAEMTDQFWMRGVSIPLDIHFFTLKGAPLNSVSAVPCKKGTPDDKCERYSAVAAYGYALEVKPETSEKLGLTGSTLSSFMEHCPLEASVRSNPTTTSKTQSGKPGATTTTTEG